ncbi:hypothetical protein GYA49_06660 [Candidatus Beckwithbacteria bacterium]|nr:hypothetical protein [Candidatus Beckwithbacteria bacterium]
MISTANIAKIKDFALEQIELYQLPSRFHFNYANDIGQFLAKKYKANQQIVLLGTILMDCMLGVAFEDNKINEHIALSAKKTKTLLTNLQGLSSKERENIHYCVLQHHGVKEFYSLEAEVCCNADCYRFVSIKGFIGGIRFTSNMKLKAIVELYQQKVEEKWQAISLSYVKQDLKADYQAIQNLLKLF